MKLYVHDELGTIDGPTIAALDKAIGEVLRVKLRGLRAPVLTVDGPHVGKTWVRKVGQNVRPREHRWIDGRCSSSLVWHLAGADRFTCAGGPSMQKQALLRANASGFGDAQAELHQERPST